MDFTIRRFVLFDGEGSLKAFCDVAVGNLLLIKGVRVVEGRTGLFVSMPRQQNKDGKWYDSIVPLSKPMWVDMSRIVLDAFERHRTTTTMAQSQGGEPWNA